MLTNHQDNTLCGARNLGKLTGTRSLNNFIGQEDRIDYYKFSLADERLFSINIGRLRSRVSVELYDRKGKALNRAVPSCISAEAIDTILEAGTYYFSIKHRKRDTRYRLTTSVSTLGTLPTSAKLEDLGQLVLVNTTKGGAVSSGNPMDYYQFTFAQSSDFTANVGNLSQPVRLSLYYDRNNNKLPDSDELFTTVDGTDTNNASFTRFLPTGRYLLGITSLSNSSRGTEYTLTLTQHPQVDSLTVDPGEDSNRAYDLGKLANSATVKELVGSLDSDDVYKFSLDQTSSFNANLSNLSRHTALKLYFDRNGNALADSDEEVISSAGAKTTSLSSDLPAGNYFISVTNADITSNNTFYSLGLFVTPQLGSLSSDPGDSASEAYDFGPLNTPKQAQDLIGRLDETDFYKFSLSQISTVSASLSNLKRQTSMTLYFDRNGNALADSGEEVIISTGAKTTNFTSDLPAGNYFLSIADADYITGNTLYDLSLFVTPQPGNLPSDPGDTASKAYDFGTLDTPKLAQDLIGRLDETDFYKFSLSQISTVSASLSNLKRQTSMTLYFDRNQNNVADDNERVTSAYGWGNAASLLVDLPEGTYFLSVNDADWYNSSNTRYNLTLVQTPKPSNLSADPPSDSSLAYDLGTLAGTVTAQDYIGSLDNRDFYQFDLSQTQTFTATLNNSPYETEMYLYADSNGNGIADPPELVAYTSWYYPYYGNPVISTSLNAGTYFLLINALNGSTGSAYNLTLTS